ncbi:MAG: RnfABCDGE type electron transport complex subunit D [Pseudomonadota bacterium]
MKWSSPTLPFLRPVTGVGAMMREVCFALIPAVILYFVFFGFGILFNLLLCIVLCAGFEALALRLQNQPVNVVLSDYSVCLTGALLALALPPYLPIYVTVFACAFAVLLAKHAYGGIGFNPFNPAMVGYVAALVCFPAEMSTWLPPGLGDLDYVLPTIGQRLSYIFSGGWPEAVSVEAVTRATPLDIVRTGLRASQTFGEVRNSPLFGTFGGYGWEWVGNGIIVGGVWLLYRGIIRWHIPVALMVGMLAPATIDSMLSSGTTPGPAFHLFSGATLLGAFFIATDPVSAATSPRGRLIFGFGIGFTAWAIRTWGGYPDGIAFAVLLWNAAVPLLDRFTAPRIMGHER